MQRANLVVDHTLAILRNKFGGYEGDNDYLKAGHIESYDRTTAMPPRSKTPEREFPLYWDKMYIDPGSDVFQPNMPFNAPKQGGNTPRVVMDNIVSIDVQVSRETGARNTNKIVPPTTIDMAIVINTMMKDERYQYKLIHELFGVVEELLKSNISLVHPVTGAQGARQLWFQDYQVSPESEDTTLSIAEGFQIWQVVTLPNSPIRTAP